MFLGLSGGARTHRPAEQYIELPEGRQPPRSQTRFVAAGAGRVVAGCALLGLRVELFLPLAVVQLREGRGECRGADESQEEDMSSGCKHSCRRGGEVGRAFLEADGS